MSETGDSGPSVVPAPLSQGAGYGVVVGLGIAYALGMTIVTRALKKTFGEDNKTTETYMVANRSVGIGLTASSVISSWTFSTALLASPYLTYWYGIALPVWWAAGQSTMICAFGWLAIQAKRRVPNAHTLLELIRARYGTFAHILWIVLCLLNNLLHFSSMLVGASAAISYLTGMNITATTYLLPMGVVVFTYFGGLKATFLTDYINIFVIMIILVWFTIKVLVAKEIGSIGELYDLVNALTPTQPVEGNYRGSYLTMTSKESVLFGIIHITRNFAIVFLDTGFWQKGFAAEVAAAVPGYILGGNAYFAIPFAFGTIMGLGALAMEHSPAFPTYPRRMTPEEVSGGLVLPYLSQAIAGRSGAGAILVLIFVSCTSIASAQLIAMSSIFSFDIYGTYINKNPTNKQIIRWSHIGVVGSAVITSTLATAFHQGGVDLNWLLYFLGILICPGAFPTAFALVWAKQTRAAANISAISGIVCGLIVWIGTSQALFGESTIRTLGSTLPCVYGHVTAFFVPLPVTIIISYTWPNLNFQWSELLAIKRVEDDAHGEVGAQASHFDEAAYFTPERVQYMKRMAKIAAIVGIVTFAGQVLLWPLPFYAAKIVFSKGLSTAWIVVALIWLWITLFVANFYPLVDGGFTMIWAVLKGRKGPNGTDLSSTVNSHNSGQDTPLGKVEPTVTHEPVKTST